MAGVFRFSNAVSDISKFIETYRKLYAALEGQENFTHDEATKVLINNGLVSSSGAIGREALARSRRTDRSRDPLYNQLKMYSEIYRMLGWYEPGTRRSNFNFTTYGEYIVDPRLPVRDLFELNALHIVSPNPLVEIRGRNVLRPFPLLLKLMDSLGGVIHRDEIVLAVLACADDRQADYIDEATDRIMALRGDRKRLEFAYYELMEVHGIRSKEVFRNYTRFPLAALKWLDFAQPRSLSNIYGSRVRMYEQLPRGQEKKKELECAIDIRMGDLEGFKPETQAGFAAWVYYQQLSRIGFDVSDSSMKKVLFELGIIAKPILEHFALGWESVILFFPFQECRKELIRASDELVMNIK